MTLVYRNEVEKLKEPGSCRKGMEASERWAWTHYRGSANPLASCVHRKGPRRPSFLNDKGSVEANTIHLFY